MYTADYFVKSLNMTPIRKVDFIRKFMRRKIL